MREIGRIRAKKLYYAGYKDINAIRMVEYDTLSGIIGFKIAINTLRQLGVDIDPDQI